MKPCACSSPASGGSVSEADEGGPLGLILDW